MIEGMANGYFSAEGDATAMDWTMIRPPVDPHPFRPPPVEPFPDLEEPEGF